MRLQTMNDCVVFISSLQCVFMFPRPFKMVNYEVCFSQRDSENMTRLSLCDKRQFNNHPFSIQLLLSHFKDHLLWPHATIQICLAALKETHYKEWYMIISTSLKFRFAEGELVVISSLASELVKACKADHLKNFNWSMMSQEFNLTAPSK